eukprot:Gregarina_sp_Poly_1__6133@NODE_323_length_9530_cov_14_322836_g275_i0_p7_GENE_NODE_323_length_9530_cov_14_322836_g275_i0NODE_323_length_9530_cov_14_322836_g275_i0_p7_ORF_typecomplete_len125_score14_58_NODE_323_length_9530_cov_14_322836_g275_i021582532
MTDELLENLFEFQPATIPVCGTHDALGCRCLVTRPPVGQPPSYDETDILTWDHAINFSSRCLNDHDAHIMRGVNAALATCRSWRRSPVSFTMSCLVARATSHDYIQAEKLTEKEACFSDQEIHA